MNVVLGVGNTLMGDDGIGLALLDGLRAARPTASVDYVHGGTGGMELLDVVRGAERLLILDAVAGGEPGEIRQLTGDQIPRMLAAKLSPHQVGLLDVFAAARLLGDEPTGVQVVGIVPADVDMRLEMTPVVTAALPAAVAAATQVVDAWEVDAGG